MTREQSDTQALDTIYFYSTNEPFGEFSNFSKHGVELDGEWWPTVEHYFQAQKFEDEAYREKILSASVPKRAADLGRSRDMPRRLQFVAIVAGRSLALTKGLLALRDY